MPHSCPRTSFMLLPLHTPCVRARRRESQTNQILDKPNATIDRQLARHLVSLYYKEPVVPESPISQEFLMDYIAYTRRFVHPEVRKRYCGTRTIAHPIHVIRGRRGAGVVRLSLANVGFLPFPLKLCWYGEAASARYALLILDALFYFHHIRLPQTPTASRPESHVHPAHSHRFLAL